MRPDIDSALRQLELQVVHLRELLEADEDTYADIPPVVGVTDAARILDLSEATVRRMCADGRLRIVRAGRRVRIPRQSIVDWLRGAG